jgi:hypothetical protein
VIVTYRPQTSEARLHAHRRSTAGWNGDRDQSQAEESVAHGVSSLRAASTLVLEPSEVTFERDDWETAKHRASVTIAETKGQRGGGVRANRR